MPSYEDLDGEQEAFLLGADLEGCTLVSGSPGTGKTVLAFHRAGQLIGLGVDVEIILFNRPLRKFTSTAWREEGHEESVRTFHSWMWKRWKGMTGSSPPQKDKFVFDFERMIGEVLQRKTLVRDRFRWGHLIIDEGQDLPKGFYMLINAIRSCFDDGSDVPAVTVFADENQRLWEDNSTLSDIAQLLSVPKDGQFLLRKNHRNTREIAELAGGFYTGLATGIPDLPDRRGEAPRLTRGADVSLVAERIAVYSKSRDHEEIGVIVSTKRVQNQVFHRLEKALGGEPGIRVQMYRTRHEKWGDEENLVFDQPGTITLVTKECCKGLEFDSVFIPELQLFQHSPGEEELSKMNLFVMCSRARNSLQLFYSALDGEQPAALKLLSPGCLDLLERHD